MLLEDGVSLTFDNVTSSGTTIVSTSDSGPLPPTGFQLGDPPVYYDISTTATFTGPVVICFDYDDSAFLIEEGLRLQHQEDSAWVDVTSSLDTVANRLCGTVTSLSLFLPVELIPDDDFDGDGCTNAAELQPNAVAGGDRDPLSFWDFNDQWIDGGRNRTITVGDMGAVVARFGTFRDPAPTKGEALAQALTAPPDLTSYHASADRAGSAGPNPWNLLPPNGTITVGDLGAVVAQFGHTCAGST